MLLSERSRLGVYRARKLAILIFFIAYSLVQCAGQYASSRGEFFPVFSWSLFTGAVNPRAELEIEILRIGETEFPEPVNYFDLDEYFERAKRRSSSVLKSAGRVLRRHHEDPAAAESDRRVFERAYLGDQALVEYQFVALTFDPVARWRTGEVIDRRVLARFSTEGTR